MGNDIMQGLRPSLIELGFGECVEVVRYAGRQLLLIFGRCAHLIGEFDDFRKVNGGRGFGEAVTGQAIFMSLDFVNPTRIFEFLNEMATQAWGDVELFNELFAADGLATFKGLADHREHAHERVGMDDFELARLREFTLEFLTFHGLEDV